MLIKQKVILFLHYNNGLISDNLSICQVLLCGMHEIVDRSPWLWDCLSILSYDESDQILNIFYEAWQVLQDLTFLSGGAGGKGVWGKPGSELDEIGVCRDVNDPNYDSESQVTLYML